MLPNPKDGRLPPKLRMSKSKASAAKLNHPPQTILRKPTRFRPESTMAMQMETPLAVASLTPKAIAAWAQASPMLLTGDRINYTRPR